MHCAELQRHQQLQDYPQQRMVCTQDDDQLCALKRRLLGSDTPIRADYMCWSNNGERAQQQMLLLIWISGQLSLLAQDGACASTSVLQQLMR